METSFIVHLMKSVLVLLIGCGSNFREDSLYSCRESTMKSTNNPRSVITDIYGSPPPPGGRRYITFHGAPPVSVSLCGLIYLAGGKRIQTCSMAAAGYRLGFKGPFAPLKKQQLPLDPRFVRRGDTPTSTRTQQAL